MCDAASSAEAFEGARQQIERIAKSKGFDFVWCKPSDPSRWFAERKSERLGYINVVSIDELIRSEYDGE